MFAFAAPFWLLLIPVLLLGLWLTRHRRRQFYDGAGGVALAHPRLGLLLGEEDRRAPKTSVADWLNGLAMIVLCMAMARPQWIGGWVPEPPQGRDLMLLIDASQTMSIPDFVVNGNRVERMAVLKGIVSRFVEARNGDRLGAIAFGSGAATLVPPTFDRKLVVALLGRLQVGAVGDDTAIGDAIGLALKQVRRQAGLRPALILFTDGSNTAGDIAPEEAVELARRMNVAIYTVQIGADPYGISASTAHGPVLRLQDIAGLTGGRYYRAGSPDALRNVVHDIGALEKTVARPHTRHITHEWYPWLLAAAAVLLTLAGLGRLGRPARIRGTAP